MNDPFIDNNIEKDISNNVIDKTVPYLRSSEKAFLLKRLLYLLEVIFLTLNIDKKSFGIQLKQNNYRDPKWLLLFLLPHINNSNELVNITSLNDIYNKKIEDNIDINKTSPHYLLSNLQYGRCIREDPIKEIQFNESHIDHNFYLLLESIRSQSNKMYVNWLDIIPYRVSENVSSQLYNNTLSLVSTHKLTEFDPINECNPNNKLNYNTLKEHLSALSISDIYNTLSNAYYNDIKRIKWLIYDVFENRTPIPAVVFLQDLLKSNKLSINIILQNEDWIYVDSLHQLYFKYAWNTLVEAVLENKSITLETHTIHPISIQRLVRSMVIIFQQQYVANRDIEGYVPIKLREDIEDDDEEEENINITTIKETLRSIKPEHIYTFWRTTLRAFKTTYYGHRLLNVDKKDGKTIDEYLTDDIPGVTYERGDFSERIIVTNKVFYNFCKSLVHYTEGGKFLKYPDLWCSLTKNDKTEILDRLNQKKTDWFSVGGYWRYFYHDKNITMQNLSTLNEMALEVCYDIMLDNVFTCMIVKGILSKFVPNPRITDEKIIDRTMIVKNPIMQEFFRDSNPLFADSYYYLTELPYAKLENFSSYNKKEGWYSMMALDWISQLGFVHHFINNRVSYITGGTGIGKSTQVPKLFMYYLKAIEYNSSARVACSQPRRNATSSNAKRVSAELSVPIYIENVEERKCGGKGDTELEETDDYYIQMKHKKESHIKKVDHLMLKFITDGSLLMELFDPLGKKKNKSKDYIDENIYDVVIIDEAHEHNKNMDLLLTILRTTIYNNNSMRLVILSATMDEDEPSYRRYYRNINDNKKYPLNTYLRDNRLDRINVDRRYHISAPGMGTIYTVNEEYAPNIEAVDIVKRIMSRGLDGDILLFQPGKKEITETVEILNTFLPIDTIALPYYSELSDKHRTFIEDLQSCLPSLKMDRDDTFELVNDFSRGNSSYKHFVLVATNIAEASITIASLKYVIDTGYQKVNNYDFKRRSAIIKKTLISETSRIQRKGRVGRTSNGNAYYLYEKGDMQNNKSLYKISSENIAEDLYLLMKDNINDIYLIDPSNDPNNPKLVLNINNMSRGLQKIMNRQYFVHDGYYNYYGNDDQYDYKNFVTIPMFHRTGFALETLMDKKGDYFIVHPDEPLMIRNINGKVIKVEEDIILENDIMKSGKMESFVRDMIDNIYINQNGNDYDKTDYGKFIFSVLPNIDIEDRTLAKAIVIGKIVGQDVSKITAILWAIGSDLKNLVYRDENRIYHTNEFNNYYVDKHNSSDLITLNNIIDDLERILNGHRISFNPLDYANELANMINIDKMKIISGLNGESIDEEEHDKGKLLKKIRRIITNKVYDLDIEKELTEKGMGTTILTNYADKYLSTLLASEELNNIKKDDKLLLDRFNAKSKIEMNKVNKMILPFIIASPYNLCMNVEGSSKYISMYAPSLNNIFSIQTLFGTTPKTTLSPMYQTESLFYLSNNLELEAIGMLTYVGNEIYEYLGTVYDLSIANIDKTRLSLAIGKYIDSHTNADRQTYIVLTKIQKALDDIKSIKFDNRWKRIVL